MNSTRYSETPSKPVPAGSQPGWNDNQNGTSDPAPRESGPPPSPAFPRVPGETPRAFSAFLAELNATWGTEFQSWPSAAEPPSGGRRDPVAGRHFDFDEYHAERFTELIAEGARLVTRIQPNALVGVQPGGGFALFPRDAVWKHRLCPQETIVLAPTGGGRWTGGHGATKPAATVLASPLAPAPLEDDLLLALADGKMLFDNETYLRGQTAVEVRNRLWEQVFAGLDGLSVFSWSKRGWAWFQDRATVQTEADKYPYSVLNPLARRTAALRGILDFALEVQPLADRILAKPWGPEARIGLLYDWAQARRHVFEPETRDKTADYYAALKYTHWNLAIVPSDRALDNGRLDALDVLILGGVRHAEPDLIPRLQSFAERGGILVVGEEPFAKDVYGRAVATESLLGVKLGEPLAVEDARIKLPDSPLVSALAGEVRVRISIRALQPGPRTEVRIRTTDGQPVVTRHRVGKGAVYVQGADVIGYPLAKMLTAILADAAQTLHGGGAPSGWRLAEIREAETGSFASNVLLSRRSYATHHALLLMNRDEFAKTVRIQVPGLTGIWLLTDGLTGKPLPAPAGQPAWKAATLSTTGFGVTLAPAAPAVLILSRPSTD